MNETLIQILVTLFFAEHFASYIVSQLIILDFSYQDAEEKRWFVPRTIPVNLLVNTLVFLAMTTAVFGRQNSFHDFLNILLFNRSYRQLSGLALSGTVCLCFSALWPLIAGVIYNRKNGGMAVRGRQRAAVLLIVVLSFVPFMLGLRIGASSLEHIELSAVCRETLSQEGADEYGRTADGEGGSYVDIYNDSPLICELEKLYLSDDPDELRYASLRSVALAPYSTYRFVLSGSNSVNIRRNGGTVLYLSDTDGNILDEVSVPALLEEEVLCKSGGEWSIVDLLADERRVYVPAPVFSADSGFYDKAFHLSLSAEKGLKIYYTVDCTTPDDSAKLYTGKIYVYDVSVLQNKYRSVNNVTPDYLRQDGSTDERVPKATVVRAVAADENGNLSDVVTKTYFVGFPENSFEGRTVVSLVSDPDGLFGENGIYITGAEYDAWYEKALTHLKDGDPLNTGSAPTPNFQKKGMDWEREADLELLSGGDSILSQHVGIRIQGNYERTVPLKRFSLFAREEYSGSDYFDIDYPEGLRCHSLLLRGGDLYAVSQRIAAGSSVDTVTPTPVAVFLDGEFWYNTYLYEKFDERNLAEKYDISKDNIAIVKNQEIPPEAFEGDLSADKIMALYESLSPSDPDIYEKLSKIIDMQSFIDEICFQCYLGNIDVREYVNNYIWHTILPTGTGADDSRWRWALYDMDLKWFLAEETFPDTSYYDIDPFVVNGLFHAPVTEWRPYVLLHGDETFREQLLSTFMDMVNSRFSVANVTSILDEFGITDEIIRTFFAQRLYYLVPRLAQEFGLSGTVGTVELSASQAGTPIRINGITPELKNGEKWTGYYYTDRTVTLSTDRDDLFFWMVTVDGETMLYEEPRIELSITEGGVKVYALFK